MTSFRPALAFALLGTIAGSLAGAPSARASQELDRKYSLESVGFLRSWDNVDGLFSEYVSQAYKDYFSKQSRFTLQDVTKADALLAKSKIPYNRLLEDKRILTQISRSLRAETIIRTKVQKEGPQYRFSLDYLHAPEMDIMSSESFVLKDTSGGEGATTGFGDLKGELAKALDAMIARVPFKGHVTGRDNSSVTVNIGTNAGLKPGDTLVVATLDEVKKHPLLHAIVDWRLSQIGKLEVVQVDGGIAFCKVTEEEPGRQITRYQKIVQVIPKPIETVAEATVQTEEKPAAEAQPTMGWISGGLWMGSFTRQFSTDATGTAGLSGGGFLTGVKADGQLWLTRAFFVEGGLGYGFWGYGQHDIATGTETKASGVSGNAFHLRADLGYRLLMSGDVFGPNGYLKIGYTSTSYQLPVNTTTEDTSPMSFHAIFIGVGGDVPIRSEFGLQLDLDFGVFPGSSQTGLSLGDTSSSTVVEFYLGGYYRLNTRMTVRAGIDVMAHDADFGASTSGTGSSISQRIFSFAPALMYYF